MTTALFARVSTTERGQDPDNQVRVMKAWCEKHGHEVAKVYEEYVSGSGTKKRPVFEQMMEDAKARKFQQVIFWSLDRFSRAGVIVTLTYLKQLDDAGCCWKSMTEEFLDSCGTFKDAILAILAAIAKQERIRISERVKAGLDRAASEGRKGGRRVIERDPKIIAKIHTLRDKGYSFNQIEEETGVPKSSVHRMMSG